ncbi:ABC transporter substrate-binding protein [Umezakia ovalisporum]|jgi:multiple sugar transport system substrate-binding protein|uniref:ABC transporter substrate-binding protein n=2 Tax=Umezakia ovalisporum TaxID=75695 RepID=A0AA43GZB7_9CYAN|nr:ABC transporter substrate-binding protein [Umezakia ovalisporum]MBI1240720.1 extracellular solute-binding protein [Nostoc sp. RI_552]MDH6056885.1 ABC transporter substrate-binding protein [Umezakia ovalisporum FSS-43]MDH6064359.1 ABC transporter substrate-binding protein [Umezakia ovalisporum FSS-62]MDH6067973.1 ABC transporter substrate-binding protein [Umezakia ovalisporum APH033B]MDH6070925.1 ABC transporter substrate-binding protein [Umezakia ovalisporum CobakiLakeA]
MAMAIAVISYQNFPLSNQTNTTVTIKLSGWAGNPIEQKLLKQLLQDFELEHPHIKVKYEVISDQYMDVLTTRLIGEAAPDVFYLESVEAPFLMSQNLLEPLNTYITPEFDLEDFEEGLLDNFKYKDNIYGLPKDYSTLALFYNQKAFAAAGLSSPPSNWDELRTYSKVLTGKLSKYGFGVTPQLSNQAYKITAFGGKVVDENGNAAFATPEALQGLQLVIDQYQKDGTSAQATDVGTNSGTEMFGQSRVAMVIDGNWAIPYLETTFPDLEFATAEVPTINDKKGTMVFTVAYVMNKQSQHKATAWELISYLTGKEGMAKWTGTGFALPTRTSVAAQLGYDQDPLRSPLVAGIDYGTTWQIGKYPATIANNFDNQFISALLGQQPLQSAMVRAENAANRQIRTRD